MSSAAKAEAVLALHRFGMGPRPGSIAAIASDPRGALIAELDRPPAAAIAARLLPSSAKAYRTVADANAQAAGQGDRGHQARRSRPSSSRWPMRPRRWWTGTTPGMSAAAEKMAAEAIPDPGRPIYLQEAKLRTEAALGAEIGFAERLVWFWSNHFCISADKIQSMSGAYEREAIRPHVLGRFVDMLLAVEGHPAMLFYLDKLASMGANSIAGINRTRGLNENLAREILELHTLGVRSGYTQDDVIAFANVLTGWTFLPPGDNPEHGGEFSFNPRLHEPGAQKVLGKTYEDEDVEQGRAVLRDLAAHPATATHIATKLARHFIADAPPAPLVERMAKTFRDTGGDLKEVARTMVVVRRILGAAADQTEAAGRMGGRHGARDRHHADRSRPLHRRTGAARRAACGVPARRRVFRTTKRRWIDGMGRRLDVANNFAERVADHGRSARHHRERVRLDRVGPEVKQAVGRAESRQQALALLFMSAEFQRR